MRHTLLALCGCVLLMVADRPAGSQEKPSGPDAQALCEAVQRGVQFLKSQHVAGNGWEVSSVFQMGGYTGGMTGLVCLTLLEAGENPDEGELKQALSYLRAVKTRKTYVLGLRMAALAKVVGRRDDVKAREADWAIIANDRAVLLEDAIRNQNGKLSGWSYPQQDGKGRPDFSNTHFALLGLNAAQQVGVEIPTTMWREVRDLYVATQVPKSGWGYQTNGEGGARFTMTLAGLAGLCVSSQQLQEKPPVEAVEAALNFIGNNYRSDIEQAPGVPFPYYTLLALSRAGPLSGVKHFSDSKGQTLEWYAETAKHLLRQQKPNGSWKSRNLVVDGDPTVATSMSVIFLARGLPKPAGK